MNRKAVCFNPISDTWELKELPMPKLSETDVLIKVKACGLNPVDAKIAQWKSFAKGMDDTWVGGLDVSGEIVEIGSEVKIFKPGDLVLTHGNMIRKNGALLKLSKTGNYNFTSDISANVAAASPCAVGQPTGSLINYKSILRRASCGWSFRGVGGFCPASQRSWCDELSQSVLKNKDYVLSLGADTA